MIATLVDKLPNLGGLCRTCEIFNARKLVLADRQVLRGRGWPATNAAWSLTTWGGHGRGGHRGRTGWIGSRYANKRSLRRSASTRNAGSPSRRCAVRRRAVTVEAGGAI